MAKLFAVDPAELERIIRDSGGESLLTGPTYPVTILGVPLTISEPMTAVTDCILTVVAIGLAAMVFRKAGNRTRTMWAWGLLFTGIAAITGGFFHGLYRMLDLDLKVLLWKGTVFSLGAMSYFVLMGAAYATLKRSTVRILGMALLVEVIAYTAWMVFNNHFKFVLLQYGSASVVAAILLAVDWWKRRTAAVPWILGGIVVALLAGAAQQAGPVLHRNFNRNDLYHVMMYASLGLLYRGVVRLNDYRAGKSAGGRKRR